MNNYVGTTVIVAAFHEEDSAATVADALKEAQKQNELSYQNVAVIRKDAKGRVSVQETADISAGPGAGLGALIGGLFGLLGGPAGVAAGAAAGAVTGGTGAAIIDTGLDNQRLAEIGDVLQPGNSAVIAVFDEVEVDKETMKELTQDLVEVVSGLAADIGATLQAGQDVSYMIVLTENGMVASRLAAGEEAGNIQAMVASMDGIVLGQAVATPGGVAYEVAAADALDAAYEAGMAIDLTAPEGEDTSATEGDDTSATKE